MSGCRTHADLIGPYVLGALEADEMESMREHLARCEACAAEARSLAGIPVLLDHARADDEVVTLSPALEEEVLDRFVKERAAAHPPKANTSVRRRPRLWTTTTRVSTGRPPASVFHPSTPAAPAGSSNHRFRAFGPRPLRRSGTT